MSERTAVLTREEPRCPSVADLDRLTATLAAPSVSEAQGERIDRIAALERLKGAAAAAQVRETAAFKDTRLADEKAAGVPVRRQGQGIAGEVALARHESPNKGVRLVRLADALVNEMPHTLAALTNGGLSEWRATLMVSETACLSTEDRREVDARMADRIGDLSDARLIAEARRHAYALDPYGFLNRGKRAESERHVSCRPAPDTMSRLSAFLPCTQGVAVFAELSREADRRRAAGDPRSRGQVMADTLVERITGQTRADQTPIEIQLQVTDRCLFTDSPEPGWLVGYGPVPAPFVRALLRGLAPESTSWIRRFFTDPCTGLLSAVDARRRVVTGILRQALVFRDTTCRTPWCGAPIRHSDHVIPSADGGETTEANTQGLCEACNYVKQAHGWEARPRPGGAGYLVEITTPTGRTYTSRPPPFPGGDPRGATDPPVARPPYAPRIEIYLSTPFALEYDAA